MRRPGPLQELPFEQFLPISSARKSRPNKRPLSPTLYSPVKRRILNEEGIFSPEKTIKSTVSSRGTPSRFTDALDGPSSPARKLDFGVPNHSTKDAGALERTPTRLASLDDGLAPSPELKSKSRSSWPGDEEMNDYFIMPNCSSSSSRSSAVPTSVPREMLPPPDPHSVHYPGFRVHPDTRILLTPVDDDLEKLSFWDSDKDGQKENLDPRQRPRKVVTTPNINLKLQPFSPDAKKMDKLGRAKSTPVAPKRLLGSDRQDSGDSPTPRRLGVRLSQSATSSTPRAIEKERREMRRALQDEADEADEDEGDEA